MAGSKCGLEERGNAFATLTLRPTIKPISKKLALIPAREIRWQAALQSSGENQQGSRFVEAVGEGWLFT